MSEGTFAERRGIAAFLLGCLGVTAGVVLHLPMFIASAPMHYRMAGMPMGTGMLIGMAAIVVGILVAGYGLLPVKARKTQDAHAIVVAAPEDAALSPAHWRLMAVLVVALTIDVMKPATLGFTMTGMIGEYGVTPAHAALVPFSAISGTVTGSVMWGAIADLYGRKASILLSAVMFVGTSICGAMPSLNWNIAMCFLMGLAAGGMLPVTYALLAETMPVRHRGWALVLVGGLGAVGGYVAASGASALLQPIFGWRILWLLNLPTGLLLVALGGLFPESPAFLIARRRRREADRVMQAFGARARTASPPTGKTRTPQIERSTAGKLIALSLAALAWGLINFGLILWLPADLVARGYSIAVSSKLLAESALLGLPMVFVAATLYARWSTRWTVTAMIIITALGLLGVLWLDRVGGSPVGPVALLILGSNGVIATLLPYAAESFPLRTRGRATGWVAACSKGGGLIAQLSGILALEPALGGAALIMLVPTVLALALVLRFGPETRGVDLRDLERSSPAPG
ncbi:MFS transporter [Hephaestia mangrovi]|uniref:MFS transporter n=1 Tax=Hephaestia mangrovi TaxID=2873268 RepID=UPI001CA637B7|nr:MFS transporter [Hephaestia mangrovi]MBY8828857.1 MFS transporter [Hephaestia mangrovi]